MTLMSVIFIGLSVGWDHAAGIVPEPVVHAPIARIGVGDRGEQRLRVGVRRIVA